MVNACTKIVLFSIALAAAYPAVAAPTGTARPSNPDAIDSRPGYDGRPAPEAAPSPTTPRKANPDGIDYRPGFGGRQPLPVEAPVSEEVEEDASREDEEGAVKRHVKLPSRLSPFDIAAPQKTMPVAAPLVA